MPKPAEDLIVRNLIETLGHLHADLDRMELWAAALGGFQHPIPEYRPGDQHLLTPSATPPQRPTGSRSQARRER
jgi:hypothetical protein